MAKISIVIRSHNDAQYIGRTINSVLAQKYGNVEILDFDNASTDGTREIIAKFPQVKLFDVPEGKYVPGRVLNDAVAQSSGEIIVFNNADAVPLDSCWLEELVRPIVERGAAASYARQIARQNAFPWIARDYARAFGMERFSPEFFSMASSAARADIFKTHRFDPEIKYSEDSLWSRGLLRDGLKVAYAPKARVEHSHNYDYNSAKKRFYGEGFADAKIRGEKFSFGILRCLKSVFAESYRDLKWLLRYGKSGMLSDSIRFRFAQKFYYRKGLRAGKREA